jgi:hypothetical protein
MALSAGMSLLTIGNVEKASTPAYRMRSSIVDE